jgi:hypothetical protein
MDVQIRTGRPEDASFLAWVILTAGRAHVQRGIWEVILGGSEEECLAFLQKLIVTKTPHHLRYSGFLVAEGGGVSVAALGGSDPKIL